MKKISSILVAAALTTSILISSGCTEETSFGPCVGLDDEKNPDLVYNISTRNMILSVIFIETIFVPVIVALDETYCPVAKKTHS